MKNCGSYLKSSDEDGLQQVRSSSGGGSLHDGTWQRVEGLLKVASEQHSSLNHLWSPKSFHWGSSWLYSPGPTSTPKGPARCRFSSSVLVVQTGREGGGDVDARSSFAERVGDMVSAGRVWLSRRNKQRWCKTISVLFPSAVSSLVDRTN